MYSLLASTYTIDSDNLNCVNGFCSTQQSTTSSSSTQPPLFSDSFLQDITPAVAIIGIGIAVAVFLMIWMLIRRFNVQEATFRIDKNLQKLVDNIDDQSYIDFQKAQKATGKTDVKLPTNDNERV